MSEEQYQQFGAFLITSQQHDMSAFFFTFALFYFTFRSVDASTTEEIIYTQTV